MSSALHAFNGRDDLRAFAPNGLLLFALELRFGIDDISSVAATSVTDGPQDRGCDLVYIDRDKRVAVIAQGYESADTSRSSAPASKAAALSAATSWIFGNERSQGLGTGLRTAVQDLHEAIEHGEVDSIEIWYSHNLPESVNVDAELERASRAAMALVKMHYPGKDVVIRSLEVGRSRLDDWYRSTQTAILITDDLRVPATAWFVESGDGWNAVCTSVPAAWLHGLYKKHQDHLFSANVRGYMPSRRQARNINFGIESTAREEPGRFWAFNNGVTALVNELHPEEATKTLTVSGFTIVNGAQTTGALGHVDEASLGGAKVMIRFVQATNPALVEKVIRYNNSQNPIQPSDFRSSDRTQDRLRAEFRKIPDVTYLGARRGGPDDRARRPSNLISSDTAAQALAAFHQDPATAYHDLRNIWESDEVYARYFGDHTSAEHIVFCYSLWRRVTETKAELRSLPEEQQTNYDKEALEYLQERGSLHLLVAAIAGAAEVYLGRPLNDSFALSFDNVTSPAVATTYWSPLVEALIPFAAGQLGIVFEKGGGLRRKEVVTSAISAFRAVALSTRRANANVFDEFSKRVLSSSS